LHTCRRFKRIPVALPLMAVTTTARMAVGIVTVAGRLPRLSKGPKALLEVMSILPIAPLLGLLARLRCGRVIPDMLRTSTATAMG